MKKIPILTLVACVLLLAGGVRAQNSLVWTGAVNSAWNTADQNWTIGLGGAQTAFATGDDVLFDNTSTTTAISIPVAVSPASIAVDISRNLTFTPAAGAEFSGTFPIIKQGAGTLTYTGTFISGFSGTITIEEGIYANYRSSSSGEGIINYGPVLFAGGTFAITNNKTGSTLNFGPNFAPNVPEGIYGEINMSSQDRFRMTGTVFGSGTLAVILRPASTPSAGGNFRNDFSNFHGELRIIGSGTATNTWYAFSGTHWADTSLMFDSAGFSPDIGNTSRTIELGALGSVNAGMSIAGNNGGSATGTTTFVIGRKNIDSTYLGALVGNYVALTKIGTGMLTLGGVNTYTGSTTVNEGALRVTGQLANTAAVTVSDSAALGGSGTITSGVAYASGATLLTDVLASGSLTGLEVVGSVATTGTLKVTPVIPDGVTLASGTYTILHATGGITGSPTLVWAYSGSGVSAVLDMNPAADTITATITAALPDAPIITSPATVTGTTGAAFTYTIMATNNPTGFGATGLPAWLDFTPATATISGTPTISGTTTIVVSASNAGGAGSQNLDIIITDPPPPAIPPSITSPLAATATVGAAFSYQIAASNAPTAFDAAPLPAALAVNGTTGLISGTVTASGTSTIVISASNAAGAGTANLVLSAYELPAITNSSLNVSGTVGDPFNYSIVVTGDPILGYAASGLPTGLAINGTTGVISGTFAVTGTSSITLSATNPVGVATATLHLMVEAAYSPLPSIASDLNATGTLGIPFNYQIVATNNPTGFDAAPLPAGLSVDNNGAITGTPTATGLTNVILSATNTTGTGTATLRLNIIEPVPADALLWTGSANNNWDKTSLNWTMAGLPTNYENGDKVLINDLSTTTNIAIPSAVLPASIKVDISRTLTLTPAAGAEFSGAFPIIKQGAGTLTYTGTFISGFSGTITIKEGIYANYRSSSSGEGIINYGPVLFAGGTFAVTNNKTGSTLNFGPNFAPNVPEGIYGEINMSSQDRFRMTGTVFGSGTLALVLRPASTPSAGGNLRNDFSNFHGEFRIIGTGTATNTWYAFSGTHWADTSLVFDSAGFSPDIGNTSRTIELGALGSVNAGMSIAGNNGGTATGVTTFIVGRKNIDSTYLGAIVGNYAALTKIGAGILTLGGINTYTGTTTVTSGGLHVTGQLTKTAEVTVASSAALGGSGTIASKVSYADASALLVTVDNAGLLKALSVANSVAFGPTLTVKPVISSSVVPVNGTYAILRADNAFTSTPALTWSYPANPAITGTFAIVNSKEIHLTIAGGAIALPVIDSAPKADAITGQPFNYAIAVTSDPASPTQLTVGTLPAGLNYDDALKTISGAPTIAGRYSIPISATNSSGTADFTLEIIVYDTMPSAPVITSSSVASIVGGNAFSYTITATNDPTSFDATGLPDGLAINTATGEISGTPNTVAVTTATIYAKNIGGTGSAPLEISVLLPPPVITSPATATVVQDAPFSYQITASNNPTGFSATGFPADFAINAETGLITGTFTTTGTVSTTIIATNGAGSGSATLAVTVLTPPPVIQSAATATAVVGADFSYQIVATHAPTNYAALNLPPGLVINTTTGLITGKPTASGNYLVSLVAMNLTGPGTKQLTLTISGESALVSFAGSGMAGLVNGPSADAQFNSPSGAAIDKDGNLYIADTDNNAVRKIATDGTVSTFATGFNTPSAIVIDAAGTTLYVANAGNSTISKIDIASHAVTALSVTGTPPLSIPHGLALDGAGNLYVADTGNNSIRKIVIATGAVTTLAGSSTGVSGFDDGAGTAATFNAPMGLALDAGATHLYVADTNNSAIRTIALASGLVETLTPTGVSLNTPQGLAIDAAGILYVADTGDNAVCTIDTASGIATTIVGGSGQTALNAPGGIVIDATGDIYVLDTGDHTICVLQTGPFIITSPSSQTAGAGSSVSFKVAATGAPTPTYQWYKDGVPITGATAATLTINPVQRTDAGNYSAAVTNSMGIAQSNSATLTVNGAVPPPSTGSSIGGGGGALGWLYLLALSLLVALRKWHGLPARVTARSVAGPSGTGDSPVKFLALLLTFILCAASTPSIHAQPQSQHNGVITGKVSSQKTGVALSAAEVTLAANGKASRDVTLADGTFRFGGLEAGNYTVHVTYADLDPQTKSVTLEAGANETLDFMMGSEVYILERFSVTAEREGQAAAMQRQRQSDVMKDVVSADAFGNPIDTNPGELLKNLPGIFINYNNEDAGSFTIRGISTNEGSFTIDGNEFANSTTDPSNISNSNRGVSLQTMSLNAIESLEVFKAPPPSSPANANGGVINAITKNAFDQKGRRVVMQTSLRLNTAALNFAPIAAGGRSPDRAWNPGANLYYSESFLRNRLGVSLSLNAYETYSFTDALGEQAYYFDIPTTELPTRDSTGYISTIQASETSSRAQRRAASLNLDYKLARHTSVFLKTSYNDRKTISSDNLSARLDTSNGRVHKNTSSFDTVEVEDSYFTMSVGGAPNKGGYGQAWLINPGVKHTFGAIRIDYDGYMSRSFTRPAQGINNVTYRSPRGHYIFRDLQSESGYTIQQLDITPQNDYLNLDNYNTLSLATQESRMIDKKSGAKANIRVPLVLFGYPLLVQGGASYTDWTRDMSTQKGTYTLNDNSASRPKYGEFYDPVRGDAWKFSHTFVPQWMSPWKVLDYFNEHPEMFTFGQSSFDDSYYTYTKTFDESVMAGYAMGSLQIRNFNIMAGVRYEYTDSLAGGYLSDKRYQNTENYRKWIEGGKTYGNFFPNVQLKYEPIPNLIFRAAYTTSIGRPGLEYLFPADTISVSDSAQSVTVVRSNTSLKPQFSNNYDLSAEYYFPKKAGSGVLTAGIFRKEISDYIIKPTGPLSELDPSLLDQDIYKQLYIDYPNYEINLTTGLNAGKATMNGFEVSYRQKLTFLPSFLKNFEIYESFSYAHPTGDISITDLKEKVSNTQLKYRSKNWYAQLSYYWCASYLWRTPKVLTNADGSITMGTDGSYVAASGRFDFSFTYQFSRVWALSLDWRNITAEPDVRVRYDRISRYRESGTLLNIVLKCTL